MTIFVWYTVGKSLYGIYVRTFFAVMMSVMLTALAQQCMLPSTCWICFFIVLEYFFGSIFRDGIGQLFHISWQGPGMYNLEVFF